jgi:hypothetical protein
MKTRLLAATALTVAAMMSAGAAFAQAPGYVTPKTAFGAPDLQGFWNNTSITSLQRSSDAKSLVVDEKEAERLANRNILVVLTKDDNSTNGLDPNNTKMLEDKNNDRGYNAFWIDPGTTYANVKGTWRSSWIVDPPSGQVPFSDDGRKLLASMRGSRGRGSGYDNPEERGAGERCIVGFGGSGGPPMMNVLYNNNYQIIQSPDHVVIVVEMNHDARVIPIGEKREAKGFDTWLGNSVGWWEGDTLVVQTRNFHHDIRVRPNMGDSYYVGENPVVTERFSRAGPEAIHYEFVVEDRDAFTRPWRGEMTLTASREPMYEYACHEGNHALPGILGGARMDDREGRVTGTVGDSE